MRARTLALAVGALVLRGCAATGPAVPDAMTTATASTAGSTTTAATTTAGTCTRYGIVPPEPLKFNESTGTPFAKAFERRYREARPRRRTRASR